MFRGWKIQPIFVPGSVSWEADSSRDMVARTFLALDRLISLEDGNNTHLRRHNYKSHKKRNKIYTCRGDGNSHRVTTNQMTLRQLVLQVSLSHRVDQTSQEKHRLT